MQPLRKYKNSFEKVSKHIGMGLKFVFVVIKGGQTQLVLYVKRFHNDGEGPY